MAEKMHMSDNLTFACRGQHKPMDRHRLMVGFMVGYLSLHGTTQRLTPYCLHLYFVLRRPLGSVHSEHNQGGHQPYTTGEILNVA